MKNSQDNSLNLEKIAIIYNEDIEGTKLIADNTFDVLKNSGITNVVLQNTQYKERSSHFVDDATFVIVIGGDGTILATARHYAKLDVPLFGINAGRLGFLAQVTPNHVKDGIDRILNGEFQIEERLLLNAKIGNTNEIALNDIVVKGGTLSRTAKLFLYINDKHVCDYIADGIIISTPTGSTAYNLSAGGPVVVPGMDVIVITPICPHSLTTRPLIVPCKEKITIQMSEDSDKTFITADGQTNFELEKSQSVEIKKSKLKAKLVLLDKEHNEYYSILRSKLHWGVSP